jgi:SAM-dependent methyltransferase
MEANETPATWHYGLVAQWWSEFNDDFRAHEIPYYQRIIENGGEPALEVACGSGRLLRTFLRAGLDVDGCDISADMIAACREKAAREGLAPTLYVQPMHELDVPRRYKTIFVCGGFGLGSTRDQDLDALKRFHDHLEPGGTLVFDIEVPYAEASQWQYWAKDARGSLPEPVPPPGTRRRASDGTELGLRVRLVDLDPLEQRITLGMHADQWRDGELAREEEHLLHMTLYFRNEVLLMLERAGFTDVRVHGEHAEREPTRDDDFLVFVATK